MGPGLTTLPETVGPILFARGADGDQCRLSAIIVAPDELAPPHLVLADGPQVAPLMLHSQSGRSVWRYDFSLPARANATYRLGDAEFRVAADCSADMRIAFVSCNGQEHGDADRPEAERNAMWRRLAREHDGAPFGLMLHGGDQLYADEVVRSHPGLSRWAASALAQKADQPFSPDMRRAAEDYYFHRYLTLYAQPEFACLGARVPSLMMWDDHDIFDGWGSLPEKLLDSPVGAGLFGIARRMFMLFQLGATDAAPPAGWEPGPRQSLTHIARFPQFSVMAPDLRSERRPTQVMGPAGWTAFERGLAETDPGDQIFIMSSVPILGPRLSWVEKFLDVFPHIQKYEDDLRDQWQSRSHRAEWQRMLVALERRATKGRNPVAVLSGEIHLASRAEMPFKDGSILHQIVASGIAHPPPSTIYPRILGLLAAFGENPLSGQPVCLKPLPGHRQTYAAERNYLALVRRGDAWSVCWELERSGRTPAMPLLAGAQVPF